MIKSIDYPVRNKLLLCYLKGVDWFLKCFFHSRSNEKKNFLKPGSKVLVVNYGHLGDGLFTMAAVKQVKNIAADIDIDLLVGSWNKEFLANYSEISNIYCFDHPFQNRKNQFFFKKWISGGYSFFKALNQIKKKQYDVAIDLRVHYPNAAFFLFFTKIPVRVGFSSGGFGHLYSRQIKWDNDVHILEAYQKLLQFFFDFGSESLLVPYMPCIKSVYTSKIPKSEYILCHLFSGDKRKDLDLNFWEKLICRIRTKGFKIILSGITNESLIREKINQLENDHLVINLCNKLNFLEFVELINKSKVVISVDTVAGHFAAMLNKPMISLYTSASNPRNWKPISSNLNLFQISDDNQEAVQKKIELILLEQKK